MSDARADRGFTLLEVLVALVIFALLLSVLAQIFQTGLCQSAVPSRRARGRDWGRPALAHRD